MLKSFKVGNFRVFTAEAPVTIDFSKTGKYDYNSDCIKNGIVKTGIMFGKNASGKSSLAYAIFDKEESYV
jgi:AAA15 family ATPase/GTPase